MNKGILFVVLISIVALMTIACNGGKQSPSEANTSDSITGMTAVSESDSVQAAPVITATDVLAFGFLGPVQESFIINYDVKDEDADILEKDEPSSTDNSETGFSFSSDGKVTGDCYGGVYIYDHQGNFRKGVSTGKTVMKRDDEGRVVYYSNKIDNEDDAMFTNEFTYDKKGRIVKVVQSFWEWQVTETFTYDGDNIYPSKRTYKKTEYEEDIESETTFTYTKFDEVGNWTERERRYRGWTTEGKERTGWRGASIDVRKITYY